ncbi:peptidoglycan DD-metalloendopeptidase family protein [Candidatus Uabimicrobium sp. HlEnr_7]|uniref:peptidoglycan DD-metalloendopeptidase family protein n=1 Tax=Candidatus Uabimicrobium helgolandensis TaxID=3095367 RepID=UPI00355887EC
MKICTIFLLLISIIFCDSKDVPTCEDCEHLKNRKISLDDVRGVLDTRAQRAQYNWPFKPFGKSCPVGHISHSYQHYSGEPYFHHGIDIRMPANTPIYSSTGGKVVNIENYVLGNDLYWEIAIVDEEGFLWQYHHVDYDSIPKSIFDAYKAKGSIASGTLIGEVVYWPVKAYGKNFHHIHVNVLDRDGNFLNPLLFLLPLEDSTAPVIENIYFVQDEKNSALSPRSLSGNVDIIAKAEDKMDNQPYQLTIYKMEYEVVSVDKSHKLPKTKLWQFDRLPGGGDINKDVYSVYKESFYAGGQYLSTSGNYYSRKFYIVVTNQNSGKVSKNGFWQTNKLPNGKYIVTVHATDFNGNTTSKSIDVEIKN